MKKTIFTVVYAALIAAFASGCATGLPGMPGANDQETAQTSDKNAYIEIIAETTIGMSEPRYHTTLENLSHRGRGITKW